MEHSSYAPRSYLPIGNGGRNRQRSYHTEMGFCEYFLIWLQVERKYYHLAMTRPRWAIHLTRWTIFDTNTSSKEVFIGGIGSMMVAIRTLPPGPSDPLAAALWRLRLKAIGLGMVDSHQGREEGCQDR